jgi:hypothetical protein
MALGAVRCCGVAFGGQSIDVGDWLVDDESAAMTGAAAVVTMPRQRAATVKPRVIGFMTIVKLRSIGSSSA